MENNKSAFSGGTKVTFGENGVYSSGPRPQHVTQDVYTNKKTSNPYGTTASSNANTNHNINNNQTYKSSSAPLYGNASASSPTYSAPKNFNTTPNFAKTSTAGASSSASSTSSSTNTTAPSPSITKKAF